MSDDERVCEWPGCNKRQIGLMRFCQHHAHHVLMGHEPPEEAGDRGGPSNVSAVELDKEGWTADAARYRRDAKFLELLADDDSTGAFEGTEWNAYNGMGGAE